MSPCDENASYKDTLGSFGCQCNDSFDCYGFTCVDVNDCTILDIRQHQFSKFPKCSDSIGPYDCQ